MVDVEPYGSSDLRGDPSDDELPSLTSASPSDDDDPEDPDYPREKKRKKKEKTRRHRSRDAEAVATSKIVVNLLEFTGKDLSGFPEHFGRFLRMTGQTHASGRVRCDLPLQCCKTKYLEKQVKQIVTKSATCHLRRGSGGPGEPVPLLRDRPLHQDGDTEPGNATQQPQGGPHHRFAHRPGPLGGAADPRVLLQRRAAVLAHGQDPYLRVG